MENPARNSIEDIAHDFNYALQLIIYHAEAALDRHGEGDPEHASLKEIRDAAERAVALTRQLVNFARKRTLDLAALEATANKLEGAGRILPPAQKPATKQSFPGGSETILLVDDNATILKISEIMLQRLGYRVLLANGPAHALRMAHEHRGEFQLLMTDMVMPEMTGKEMADAILPENPGLKVLFMSGFTSDITGGRAAVVDENKYFIMKPFTMQTISEALRKLLDHPSAPST